MDSNERKTQGQPQKTSGSQERKPAQSGGASRKKPSESRQTAPRPQGAKAGSSAQKGRTERQQEAPEKKPRTAEKTGKSVSRPQGKTAPARQNGKKPVSRPVGDSGYQPYKAANERKKAERKGKTQKFFSGENPAYKSLAGAVQGFQNRRTENKKKKKTRFDTPAVVYTQPKAFNRDRLLVQLLTVLAVVLALVMGLSVFFKVKVVTVSGAEVYSAWTIREASGISEGDNLLTFSRARASGQIVAKLPYVKTARIGIKLPDTVNIEIEEENVVYSIQADDGVWWLITSGGKVVEQTTAGNAENYTQVLGVTIAPPQPGEIAAAMEAIPAATAESGETVPDSTEGSDELVPLSVTGVQRLSAALEILRELENNDIVGQAASVDVSRLDDIILWYGTQYQANLGGTNDLPYKIATMSDAILQLSDYQAGILDLSFTTWKDQVGFTPFE